MQTRGTFVVLIALSAILTLDGCAWTKRTWNRVWGRDTEESQEEAKRQAEQEPAIVTGAEGDIASPSQPATTAAGEPIPGMPETQAPKPRAPTPAPTGELPSATSAPAVTTPAPAAPPRPATDMKKPGDDTAMAEPKGKVITLQADSTFAFGKSELSAAGKRKLDDLAARIAGMDKASLGTVTVIGHADRIGAPERNQALSQRRADAVKAYLAGHGVDAMIIKSEGRGSSESVVSCPGEKVTKKLMSCLESNRRVEVLINAR
jgi:outer membrane protein OmpA-like peptidoglycan-associated protein